MMVQPLHTRLDIGRDGNQLILKSDTVLPARCIKTNEPVSPEDMVKQDFYWCSPWVALMIVLSGLLLVIVYFLARKKCTLTFGLLPAERVQRRKRKRLKLIATVVLFFAVMFAGAFDNTAIAAVAVILFIVAVVAMFIGNAPLSVTNHREGNFWVKGFSPEFLNSIVPE